MKSPADEFSEEHVVRYPTCFVTTDIVCIHQGKLVLICKENSTKWQLPGGFLDPSDHTFEEAARRELKEETNLTPVEMEYMGEFPIADSRYVNTPHSIITTLFYARDSKGLLTAQDDAFEVDLFPLNSLSLIRTNLLESHLLLFNHVAHIQWHR